MLKHDTAKLELPEESMKYVQKLTPKTQHPSTEGLASNSGLGDPSDPNLVQTSTQSLRSETRRSTLNRTLDRRVGIGCTPKS